LNFSAILIIFHYVVIISIFRYTNKITATWPATQCCIQIRYLLPQQRIAQAGIIEHRTAPNSPLPRYRPGPEKVDNVWKRGVPSCN